ncbi:hypothetical protein HA402_015383 [Bradysia odoriphaga]|nr:hypothetical protein HA402_015383 [Bradysia odoriphaga]
MKYFVLLLMVALVNLVHSEDGYVLKIRTDASETFRKCLSTLAVTRDVFKETEWSVDNDNPVVQATIKCVVKDFGLFDETKGFNRDRMVKQFGGEALRTRVEKCIDKYPIGVPTVDHSVQSVMNCLEEDNLKMYDNNTNVDV